MEGKKVKFIGKVVSDRRKDGTMRVHSLKQQKDFILQTKPDSYIPFAKGDCISCISTVVDANTLNFSQLLQTELGQDRMSIITCFIRALPKSGFSGRKSDVLYRYLESLVERKPYDTYGGVGKLVSYLADAHHSWTDKKRPSPSAALLKKATLAVNGRMIPCLTPAQIDLLFSWWRDNYDLRRLYCMGLTFDEIEACRLSPLLLYEEIMTNPYGVPQLSLEKCKELDYKTGRTPNDYDITLGSYTRKVHFNTKNLKYTCSKVANIRGYDLTEDEKTLLQEEFRVYFDKVPNYPVDDMGEVPEDTIEAVYLGECLEAETGISDFIVKLLTDDKYFNLGEPIFNDDRLDERQREAVTMAMRENFSIIYGPAGSGKTTVIRTILYNLELQGVSYLVTSFTGKAVRRACEANGIADEAATMHRVLYGSGPKQFDVVVIDESSMVDLLLMWTFVKTNKHRNIKFILIGDPNQLLPIEWGNFFCSCIDSRSIPRVELDNVYRSMNKDGSPDGIIINATKMTRFPYDEMFLFEEASNVKMYISRQARIYDLLLEYKTRGYTQEEITIITPYRNLPVEGQSYKFIDLLNSLCQRVWHSLDENITDTEGKKWYVGDRVAMNQNVNELELTNGQEGIVESLSKKGLIVAFNRTVILKNGSELTRPESEYLVDFGVVDETEINEKSRKVVYKTIVSFPFYDGKKKKRGRRTLEKKDDDDNVTLDTSLLGLAYAITIHGSQGSEWKVCIFSMPEKANISSGFLNRNMMYVATTRASEELVLLDPMSKISHSVGKKAPYRCELLQNRLKSKLPRLYEYVAKKFDMGDVEVEYADDMDFLLYGM